MEKRPNRSYSSQKTYKNVIVDNFLFEIIYGPKFSLKSSHIEIQNFQITSDGETTATRVVDL
jgi:hypothetical protein